MIYPMLLSFSDLQASDHNIMNIQDGTVLQDYDYNPSKLEYEKFPRKNQIAPAEKIANNPLINCKVKNSLRPLILSLKIVGLFYYDCNAPETQRISFFKVYSASIMSLLWLNFIRCFSIYDLSEGFGASMLMRALYQIWFFMCAISSTTCYISSMNGGGWHKFFKNWLEIAKCLDKSSTNSYLTKRLYLCLSAVWFIVLVNVSFGIYCQLETNLFEFTLNPIPMDVPYRKELLWVVQFIQFYATCAWLFPTTIVFFLSLTLCLEFTLFHQEFKECMTRSNEPQSVIEDFRDRHNKICHLTNIVDDMTCFYNGVVGGLSILMAMLTLTVMFWYPPIRNNPVTLLFSSIWLSVSILIVMFIFIGGGLVNHMVILVIHFVSSISYSFTPSLPLSHHLHLNLLCRPSPLPYPFHTLFLLLVLTL